MKILTFDGGGIMGVFSTTIMERLVHAHPSLLNDVDLIAGNSTGGIIAMSLADGLDPAVVSSLYRDKARKIFDDSLWDNIVDLGNAVGADYKQKGLRQELKKLFGDRTLSSLQKRVLIPAFDLRAAAKGDRPESWKPKFFHNFPGADSDGNEQIVDVALRTSAAPTYFPSYQGYIDGGVVANNPTMAAVVQALDPRAGHASLDELSVLSIGTGTELKYIRGEKLDWGWGQWARPLVSLMISGTMGVVDHQCKLLLGERYKRIDAYLYESFDMDETNPECIEWLIDQAMGLPLDDVVEWLGSHW